MISFIFLIISSVLILCTCNIAWIPNFMISDIENGIQSLEVRRGVNLKYLIFIKLLIVKLITLSFITYVILQFVILQSILNPLNNWVYSKGILPGLCSLYALDILMTGIIFIIGSSLKIKLTVAIPAFISSLFTLSPIVGVIQFSAMARNSHHYMSDGKKVMSELLDQRKAKPNGLFDWIVKNLKDLNSYNQSFSLKEYDDLSQTEKDVAEKIKNGLFEKEGFLTIAFSNTGFLVDGEEVLNEIRIIKSIGLVEQSNSFKQSNIYKFLNLPVFTEGSGKFEDTFFNKQSHANISGKGQLDDVIKVLNSQENIDELNKELNLEIDRNEMIAFNKILKDYFVNYLAPNHIIVGINKYFERNSFGIGDTKFEIDEKDAHNFSMVRNGAKLYQSILFNAINDLNSLPDKVAEETQDMYDAIVDKKITSFVPYVLNPLTGFNYMTIFSGINTDFEQEIYLARSFYIESFTTIRLALPITDREWEKNFGETYNSDGLFPVSSVLITKKIIPTKSFYMAYFFSGLILLVIGYFIYIKKIVI
ncbi:hypothetical protein [Spiroplasma chinense]|nr:hypothetical protein [Spiroplasma chinense]